MGIGGAALGAAGGFIAGGLEGVIHGLGEYADIALACVGAVLGVAVGYGSARAANKRGNELKTWCAAHGWIWLGSRPPWGRGVADSKSTIKKSKVFWHQGSWRDVLIRDEGKTPAIFAERVIRRDHQPNRVSSSSDIPGTAPTPRSSPTMGRTGSRGWVEGRRSSSNRPISTSSGG